MEVSAHADILDYDDVILGSTLLQPRAERCRWRTASSSPA
jgi:hypothetical protein